MAEQNKQYNANLAEQYKIVGILGQKHGERLSPDVSTEALNLLERSSELQKELGDLIKY